MLFEGLYRHAHNSSLIMYYRKYYMDTRKDILFRELGENSST